MTDMTAEQAPMGPEEAFATWCNQYGLWYEPNFSEQTEKDCHAAFTAGRDYARAAVLQALSALRVPDGFHVERRPDCIIVTRLSDMGSVAYWKDSPRVAEVMGWLFFDAMLTAAQSPAEPYCKDCHSVGMIHCSDPVNCKPAEPAQDELAKLRERVKVLEENWNEVPLATRLFILSKPNSLREGGA